MTKPQALDLLMLLSALERLDVALAVLRDEVL